MLPPGLLGKCTKAIPAPGNNHKRMPPPGKPKGDLGPNASRGPRHQSPPLADVLVTHSDRTAAVAVVFPK